MLILHGIICKTQTNSAFSLESQQFRKTGKVASWLASWWRLREGLGGEAEAREGRRIMDATTSARSEPTGRPSEPSTLQGTLGSLNKWVPGVVSAPLPWFRKTVLVYPGKLLPQQPCHPSPGSSLVRPLNSWLREVCSELLGGKE